MNWHVVAEMQTLAHFSAGRMLNGVAEGTALAAAAWMLLRVVRRPNSSTRFAVWFAVLLVIAALPFIGLHRGGAAAGPAKRPRDFTSMASLILIRSSRN